MGRTLFHHTDPSVFCTLTANDNSTPLSTYHALSLTPYIGPEATPLNPLQGRGCPRKKVAALQNQPPIIATLQKS